MAEGAKPLGKDQVYAVRGNNVYFSRLGGIGMAVEQYLEEQCNIETRTAALATYNTVAAQPPLTAGSPPGWAPQPCAWPWMVSLVL